MNSQVGLTDVMSDDTTAAQVNAKGHIIETVSDFRIIYSLEVDANFDSSRRVLTIINNYAAGFAQITVELL